MTESLAPPLEEGAAAPKEGTTALVGRTLSERYKIVDLIATGGMGAVYRAEHLLLRKHVAIKVLRPEVEGFPELVARFEREAVAGAHVEHPNVATASDFGRFDDGACFLVLELVRGSTLRDLMARGPIAPLRAAWIVRQVAAGLSAVHRKGIVHRDIKPRNIMIVDETRLTRRSRRVDSGADDMVKLIDFGLAKVPVAELSPIAQDADNGRRSLTAAGVVMGTVGYLAPEAALGTRAILAGADLYSLGVVFYEMVCGRMPFDGEDPLQIFAHHRNSPVPFIRERNPSIDVPPAIEDIVRRLLQKDPEDRYPSADALVAALDGALAAQRALALGGASVRIEPEAPREAAKRRWGAIAGASALAVAILVAVATYTGGGGSAETQATASAPRRDVVAPPVASAAEVKARLPASRLSSRAQTLRTAVEAGDGASALTSLVELADHEPGAFADRTVQIAAASAVEAASGASLPIDAAFDRLAYTLGTEGLDVLYDLVARELRATDPLVRSGVAPPTGPGPRARALLGRTEVLQRATPAMRVAYELRRSSCAHRRHLVPRAGREGDDRALEILKSMSAPACTPKDACCFGKNRELERAVADIQTRLRH